MDLSSIPIVDTSSSPVCWLLLRTITLSTPSPLVYTDDDFAPASSTTFNSLVSSKEPFLTGSSCKNLQVRRSVSHTPNTMTSMDSLCGGTGSSLWVERRRVREVWREERREGRREERKEAEADGEGWKEGGEDGEMEEGGGRGGGRRRERREETTRGGEVT